jgi:hypothetical protein
MAHGNFWIKVCIELPYGLADIGWNELLLRLTLEKSFSSGTSYFFAHATVKRGSYTRKYVSMSKDFPDLNKCLTI